MRAGSQGSIDMSTFRINEGRTRNAKFGSGDTRKSDPKGSEGGVLNSIVSIGPGPTPKDSAISIDQTMIGGLFDKESKGVNTIFVG